MANGLDTAGIVSQATLNSIPSTYTFICRYYSRFNADKTMTYTEAKRISDTGRFVVSVYQDANNHANAFSYDIGYDDGYAAWGLAQAAKQPTNTPIYFAVDFNPEATGSSAMDGHTAAEVKTMILNYFRGVRDAFQDRKTSTLSYAVGVYGCGTVCQYIKASYGLATYSWLAGATGWPGYNNYNDPTKYNLKQLASTVTYNGVLFDKNVSSSLGGGGWRIL